MGTLLGLQLSHSRQLCSRGPLIPRGPAPRSGLPRSPQQRALVFGSALPKVSRMARREGKKGKGPQLFLIVFIFPFVLATRRKYLTE